MGRRCRHLSESAFHVLCGNQIHPAYSVTSGTHEYVIDIHNAASTDTLYFHAEGLEGHQARAWKRSSSPSPRPDCHPCWLTAILSLDSGHLHFRPLPHSLSSPLRSYLLPATYCAGTFEERALPCRPPSPFPILAFHCHLPPCLSLVSPCRGHSRQPRPPHLNPRHRV